MQNSLNGNNQHPSRHRNRSNSKYIRYRPCKNALNPTHKTIQLPPLHNTITAISTPTARTSTQHPRKITITKLAHKCTTVS